MIKLLFIDDNAGICETLRLVFKTKANYKLFFAESGQEALQTARKEKPDLVVLDMLIPDISGEEVFRHLKKINPDVKVIFITGMPRETVTQKLNDSCIRGILEKPFDVLRLEEYFKKAVPELYK